MHLCLVLSFSYFYCIDAIADVNCRNENRAIPATTPTKDFIIHGNGTVTHKRTKLMWMRCGAPNGGWNPELNKCNGQGDGIEITYSWHDALELANSYTFAGYSDWRLPSKNELASIVEWRCHGPSVNRDIFFINGWYTTSSSVPYKAEWMDYVSSNSVWMVSFGSGDIQSRSKNEKNRVILVRGGF